MSLPQKVDSELKRLAQAGTGGAPPRLVAGGPDGELAIDLAAVGPIGCAFTLFAYTTDAMQDATIDELKQTAEDLERRLSYLLERIQPVEVDEDACIVQMRSRPPAKDDDGTKYYELVVKRGELSLRRFSRQPGQARVVVPAEVTHEIVVRLARDFVAAAS